MQIEETPPNKPKFVLVVYLFAAAVVVIFLAAIIVIAWRNRKGYSAPYTKRPVSLLALPSSAPPAPLASTRLYLKTDADQCFDAAPV